ncbi:hypothetical protein HYV43_06720 [Candidatus Micrarchaeota archaeon]|nr:hypothetical protein [Candidatus Micrarchaeota archaeon]
MTQMPLWRRIGRVPTLEQALDLVLANRTRFGRIVRSQSVDRESRRSIANARIREEVLQTVESELESKNQERMDLVGRGYRTGRINRKILQLENQRRILTAMTRMGDRAIHATELASALALVHGLHADDLAPHFNAAIQLSRRGLPAFEGSMSQCLEALHRNLLKQVHDVLDRRPLSDPAMSGVDLQRHLHADERDVLCIRNATGLLDLMGAVQKGPLDSGQLSYVWAHARHGLPEPLRNYSYLVLKDMVQRWNESGQSSMKVRYSEPSRKRVFPKSKVERSRQVSLSEPSVGPLFENLSEAGLIEPHVLSDGLVLKYRGHIAFRPTADALSWVAATVGTGTLHPQLRVRLLGNYSLEKPPVTAARLERILKEVRFRRLVEEDPNRQTKSTAQEVGLPAVTALGYRRGSNTTLRGFKPENIRAIALHIRSESPEDADWLERHAAHLEENRGP